MKKVKYVIVAALIFCLSAGVNAQSKTGVDYFEGKWSVLLKGLPQGDTKMVFILEKKDGNLVGLVQDSTGVEISKVDKVEVADGNATVYFKAQGYDVNLSMN